MDSGTMKDKYAGSLYLWHTQGRRATKVNTIEWSPDGKTIATSIGSGNIRIWDVKAPAIQKEFKAHNSPVHTLAWSPAQHILASVSAERVIRLWNTDNTQLIKELDVNGTVSSMCWSPDGRMLALGVGNRYVQVWDAEDDKFYRMPREHNAYIRSLAWSPDSNRLASGADNGTMRLWNARTRKRLLTLQGHRTPIRGLAWSPDGGTLASGAENGLIRLWNTTTGVSDRKVKTHNINSLAWSPDGSTIASGAVDGAMRFWDAVNLKIRRRPKGHTVPVNRIVYSPDGIMLASVGFDEVTKLWDAETGKLQQILSTNAYIATSLAWSPTKSILASGASDSNIRLWDAVTGDILQTLKGHNSFIRALAWHPKGRILASSANEDHLIIWDAELGSPLSVVAQYRPSSKLAWSPDGHILAIASAGDPSIRLYKYEQRELSYLHDRHWINSNSIAWSPDSKFLASGSEDGDIRVWDTRISNNPQVLRKGHASPIVNLVWSPDGYLLSSGSADGIVGVWNVNDRVLLRTLEGHSSYIRDLAWSPDGRVLISAADDGSVFAWETQAWQLKRSFDRVPTDLRSFALSFHSASQHLEVLGDEDAFTRSTDLDINALLSTPTVIGSFQYTSAKIVLVGESNVGKSCLALRLTENRYKEQGTTHGMHIWQMALEQLSTNAITPEGEIREVLIWDMGGQDEYRLVHQLFLHDTTLALVLLDPTRGRTAFEEAEGWNLRLEKQLHGRDAVKILVGTKLDEDSTTIDQISLDRLTKECGFTGYYPTSAKTGRGIAELSSAISNFIDWKSITKTSRTTLFQRIREEIERRQRNGEVVVLCSEIEDHIRHELPEHYDSNAVNTVVEQLAIQGMIADTRLASEERVLVLQISEIERYAGSLIIAARNNPRGVPAIEEQMVTSAKLTLPGIKGEERLHRFNERIVLECVVQLLLEHGICLRHEGLLIFPSLFQPATSESILIPHSISLYYDFSGAIDNIYSSLVVKLALSERFGRVRLWEDRAEYEIAGQGLCGLRKVGHRSGLAHLDLFFSSQSPEETRNLFTVFIEEHLRKEGVRITEVLKVTCACGYEFQESSLRKRFAEGRSNIICPECETRTRISEGAERARSSNPEVEKELVALKTIIDSKSKEVIVEAKQAFDDSEEVESMTTPLRILHLSDLHIGSEADVISLIQPLIQDVEDPEGGIGATHLDYLVISGDLTNRATPEEFEQAYQFISNLISYFQLTAERCIVVPGNHDLSWESQVYDWKQQRRINIRTLAHGSYYPQGEGFLIRSDTEYPTRFENFAKFYHSLLQQQYPLKAEDQCIPTLFDVTRIQILAMNSSWEIDEFFPTRSGINDSALSRGLVKADEQIRVAKEAGRIPENEDVLRIAVWHHPATGNEKIINDAFIDRLRQARVRLCLHGHIHEERADIIKYIHPRRMHVIGAGSFGAPAKDRPESVPRLYNVIEVERDLNHIKVHTRSLRKEGGAWEGWAVWPGSSPNERLTYYEISF